MKFLCCLVGEGEGCDYTIGCNLRVDDLEADSIEEAIEEVLGKNPAELDPSSIEDEDFEYRSHGYAYRDDIESITLYEISNVVDLTDKAAEYRQALADARASLAKKSAEKAERAQYERLKKKFG